MDKIKWKTVNKNIYREREGEKKAAAASASATSAAVPKQ